MLDLRVNKTDFPRLIVKVEAFEIVPGKIVKPAVHDRAGMAVVQFSPAVLDQERSILNRQTFGQIVIMREEAAAVADGEKRGNQIEMIALARLLHLFQAAEKFGGLLGK